MELPDHHPGVPAGPGARLGASVAAAGQGSRRSSSVAGPAGSFKQEWETWQGSALKAYNKHPGWNSSGFAYNGVPPVDRPTVDEVASLKVYRDRAVHNGDSAKVPRHNMAMRWPNTQQS